MTEYLGALVDWNSPDCVAVFDEVPLWSAMFGAMLLEHVPLLPGLRVLDLGCGAGFPLLELAGRLGRSCTAYGLDGWRGALQRARQKIAVWGVSNARLVHGDGGRIPFPAGTFDLIVSNLGINNFQNRAAVLQECARVSRIGARLVLTTNLRGHMEEFYTVYAQVLRDGDRADLLPALEAHVRHRITVEAACAELEAVGFAVRQVHERTFTMRYLDGSAFLRHAFTRLAFMEAWLEWLPPDVDAAALFRRIEGGLNRLAAERGELALTIPMAYLEAEKAE